MNADNSSGSARDWRSRERRPVARDQADAQQGWTAQDKGSSGSFRQYDRPPPKVMRSPVPVVSDVPREGTQPPLRTTRQYSGRNQSNWNGHNQTHRWSGNWRNDHRYNWQDRRRHNRSLFRLGVYYDPFGWGYQRFSIGWRLWPNYYGTQLLVQSGAVRLALRTAGIPVGPLLQRRLAGRYMERPGRRRDLQLLLVGPRKRK